jgi:hypothetical protein
MPIHHEEDANHQLNPTHFDHAQKRKIAHTVFAHEKRLKIPIMIRRDAISLTCFRAFGGPAQKSSSRSSYFRASFEVDASSPLLPAESSNFFE